MDALSIYDVSGTLANIDAGVPRLLTFGALALICNFIYFGTAAWLGFKHRIYPMPLIGTLVFIPHDMHYLLMWDLWFNVYDHWFMQLFFVGLIITNILEMVFFYQTIRFGREELLPQVSQRTWVTLLFAMLAGVCFVWASVKAVIADELWFFSFGCTIWFCVPFAIPLMLRRGPGRGQSPLMWGAYTGMAICWWIAVWPLDPFFRSPAWLGLGAVTVLWGLATFMVARRMVRPENDLVPRDAPVAA